MVTCMIPVEVVMITFGQYTVVQHVILPSLSMITIHTINYMYLFKRVVIKKIKMMMMMMMIMKTTTTVQTTKLFAIH